MEMKQINKVSIALKPNVYSTNSSLNFPGPKRPWQ